MTDGTHRPPGDTFLARRARLKAERQRAAREPLPPAESGTQPAPESPPLPPTPALTDADMPPVESLTAESNFSQFLAEGVSDVLRRAALDKLFHLPEFNVLDGLNDYDDDYTKFEKLGTMVTYQQRRMRARDEALAREKEAAEALEPAAEETAATTEGDPDDEMTETANGVAATRSLESTSLADGEEVEDDGDLEI